MGSEPASSVGVKVPSPQEIPTPPAENKSEKISIECIRDAATYISLPKKSQEDLAQGKDNTVKVEAAGFPETTICDQCHVYKTICSCKKQCDVCQECKCTNEYVASLKTRITNNMTDEPDVISLEDQSDISALIEEKFDAFNLVPPDISPTVDLSHVADPKAKELVEALISAHDKAFSTHKFDVGHFLGFEAELDCVPGSSVIERERIMKPQP